MKSSCGILCRACMDAHNYRRLVARWRELSARSGFRMRRIARADGYAVYGVRTGRAGSPPGGYVSAGIHGDEPAGVWALLEWAAERAALLRLRNWTLMPCLNPWGLVANSRTDSRGRDLNRSFHLASVPMVRGWRRFVGDVRFPGPTIHLHEDYDGDGIYAYYIGPDRAVARRGIAAAARIIGVSRNPKLDSRWRHDRGLVRMPAAKGGRQHRPRRGVEARRILAGHSDSVTTLETPSEVALELRVEAHKAYLDAVAGPLLKG